MAEQKKKTTTNENTKGLNKQEVKAMKTKEIERDLLNILWPLVTDPNDYLTIPRIIEGMIEKLLNKKDSSSLNKQEVTMLLQYYMAYDNEQENRMQSHFNAIYSALEDKVSSYVIEGRRKSFVSYLLKIAETLAENRGINSINDIYAFRIIILNDNISDCYKVATFLMEFFPKVGYFALNATKSPNKKDSRIKDYIQNPKASGYKSLHIIFENAIETKDRFEVQIKTSKMHAFNEHSPYCNHDSYKTKLYYFKDIIKDFDLSRVCLGTGENNKHLFEYYTEKNPDISETDAIKEPQFDDYIGLIDSVNMFNRAHTNFTTDTTKLIETIKKSFN